MTALLGFIIGCFGGFLMIRRMMEKRLYMILVKSGTLSNSVIEQLMYNYKNYNRIQKQIKKAIQERALKMEMDYELKHVIDKDSKSEEIPVKTDIPKL